MEEVSSFIPRNMRKRKLPKPTIWEELQNWFASFAVSLVIAALLFVFVGKTFTVSGQSMYPTLHNLDRMFMSKLGDIHRFDVVVLHAPDQDKEYIKRVIGMPGDTIAVVEGKLYINGIVVEQPFINKDVLENKTVYIDDFTLENLTGETTVPDGKYFVMGDNRGVSKDSRMIGFIERSAIEGKAVFTIWPFNRIGGQTNYSYLYSE